MRKLLVTMLAFGALAGFGCETANLSGFGGDQDSGDNSAGENDGSDDGGDDQNDDGDDGEDGDDDAAVTTLSGVIDASNVTKRSPTQQDNNSADGFVVQVQSAETGETYTGQTNADGSFAVDVPDEEKGNTFMVTIVNPFGQPLGAMVFADQGNGQGSSGIAINGDASLGTFEVPENPGDAAVKPGDDKNLDNAPVSEDVVVHLDANGVPVGAGNVGKGDDALVLQASGDAKQALDSDFDGMVDGFDADDNGNGTIDDFDPTHQGGDKVEDKHGVRYDVFMNLKIGDAHSNFFFTGDEPGIINTLETQTVITFEVYYDGRDGRELVDVRVRDVPGPAYMPASTVLGPTSKLWSEEKYALKPVEKNHFNQFVVPNDLLKPGDTFIIDCYFGDGSVFTTQRMINYVFRSIPKLAAYGPSGATAPLSGGEPFSYDGTQDLELRWNPPVDEFGRLIIGFDYRFEIFFHAAGGQQIDGIDGAATWPAAPTGFNTQTRSFDVAGTALAGLAPDNTLSVVLSKDIFVSTVQTGGGPVAVETFVIDIAAQKNGNNSALKVRFDELP